MRILRVLNNNVVIVNDDNEQECVVIGKGIAFQKKNGQWIDQTQVDKIFRLAREDKRQRETADYNNVPDELFNIVIDIVKQASFRLDRKIHKSLYASLLDHLNFATERGRQQKFAKSELLWDIKRLYAAEYSIGLVALNDINQKFNIALPEDEAAFIALHLLNAQQEGTMPDVAQMSRLIQNILNIVKYHFQLEYDEQSIDFQRFITHLKFFSHRLLSHAYVCGNDAELHNLVALKYGLAYACAEKINLYLTHEYQRVLTDDEMMFLSLHIEHVRLSSKN
ncbi:BglG family transcription antiterminator LicT [Sodalis sp. RH21]|uniref:BglG family transcription antiterminator LicT n=1 Tax=unclassified Sodalis (in: enterobacteria) TaxID=2636512 RepID=UPI0039B37CF3